ncbi:MAG: transcriptional repressor [Bacillus subtilis]|nr:transcriptional repressor [Bacillus subtilis]
MDSRFHGLRATAQRVLIYDYLFSQTTPKSVEEIYQGLPAGELDLSTVYRTLDAFAKSGIVTKSFMQNRVYYHLVGHQHKHFTGLPGLSSSRRNRRLSVSRLRVENRTRHRFSHFVSSR